LSFTCHLAVNLVEKKAPTGAFFISVVQLFSCHLESASTLLLQRLHAANVLLNPSRNRDG